MALTYSKLYLLISKYGKNNLFAALLQGNGCMNFPSVAHYSTKPNVPGSKLSKAMKSHLERAEKYQKFMKEQFDEYELGKKFLANMMGKKPEEGMTQSEVDKAIDYLFPSSLYVPKARPMMKSPDLIFEKEKKADFDYSGRPFSFLYYTSKPNFSQCLHDAAVHLESLNKEVGKREPPQDKIILSGGRWFTKEEIEKEFSEKLYDIEYDKFIEVFVRLSQHPFALAAETFIKKYWKPEANVIELLERKEHPEEKEKEIVVNISRAKKKNAIADVTLTFPGTGKIEINNMGIDFFHHIERREQVMWQPQWFGQLLAGYNSDVSHFAPTCTNRSEMSVHYECVVCVVG